jgi:hypothetical protein
VIEKERKREKEDSPGTNHHTEERRDAARNRIQDNPIQK